MRPAKHLLGAILLAVVVRGGAPVSACSIPVFRYALAYWTPDRYEVIVFHRGALEPEHRAVVDGLERIAGDEVAPCNIIVQLVDLEGRPDDVARSLWKAQKSAQLPWMVLLPPVGVVSPEAGSIWSGPLSQAAAKVVLDSPVRREIARHILQGESAVWVLLESGDRAKDDAAEELLRVQLKRMEKAFETRMPLPALPAEAEDPEEDEAGWAVAFSLVRLARSDPAERVLVNALLESESDLRELSGPMAFPVFGRGRVLYALVDKGINAGNIAEACAFVVDGCSCLIKVANPGTDLLIRADWEGSEAEAWDETPSASALVGSSAVGPPAEASSPGAYNDWLRALLRNSLLGVAGGLGVVAAVVWILTARERSARRQQRG